MGDKLGIRYYDSIGVFRLFNPKCKIQLDIIFNIYRDYILGNRSIVSTHWVRDRFFGRGILDIDIITLGRRGSSNRVGIIV